MLIFLNIIKKIFNDNTTANNDNKNYNKIRIEFNSDDEEFEESG